MKLRVRWRFVFDHGGGWSCWHVNGQRVFVTDPKRLGRKKDRLEERVLRIMRRRK